MGKYLVESYEQALRENAALRRERQAWLTRSKELGRAVESARFARDEAQEELRKCQQDAIQLQAQLAEAEASRQRMTENTAAFAEALDERRVENEAIATRLAGKEALLRDIYSYAEDQGMETLMAMIDTSAAPDSADDVRDPFGNPLPKGRTAFQRYAATLPDSADDDASHEPTCRQLREPLGYCNCNAGSASEEGEK